MSVRDFVLLALGFGCLIAYSRMASLGFDGYLSGGVIETTDQWYAVRCGAGLVHCVLLYRFGLGPGDYGSAVPAFVFSCLKT